MKFAKFEILCRALSRRLGWVCVAAFALASCGGVGTGGTGGYASGPISGFGSVIVNDVRYDESAARVVDGDGNSRTSGDLLLGMTVEIDSSAVATSAGVSTATANLVRYDSELLGPLSAVDLAGNAITVLGQKVTVDPTTVFSAAAGGLAGLRTGSAVEVFAVYDPAALRYRATRVGIPGAGSTWHLRGPVSALNTVARTLRIGTAAFGYGSATGVPADLADGQIVRLKLSSTGPVTGPFTVIAFGMASTAVPDTDIARIKGLVSELGSPTRFSVNGRAVDASTAVFEGGRSVSLGARVTVTGALRGGVLRATSVSVITDEEEDQHAFELHGRIDSVDAVAGTFTLRGQTVATTRGDLVYVNGNAAGITVGRSVQVDGLLSADGLRIDATRIRFQ
jgi:hypothetical protein